MVILLQQKNFGPNVIYFAFGISAYAAYAQHNAAYAAKASSDTVIILSEPWPARAP